MLFRNKNCCNKELQYYVSTYIAFYDLHNDTSASVSVMQSQVEEW